MNSKTTISKITAYLVKNTHKTNSNKPKTKDCWVMDIGDPGILRVLDINNNQEFPDKIPGACKLKRASFFGKGPKRMIIRMPGANGCRCVDPYEEVKPTSTTPLMLYVDLTQPEMRALFAPANNFWNKLQTGAYATALIVLVAVIALVIIILLGQE